MFLPLYIPCWGHTRQSSLNIEFEGGDQRNGLHNPVTLFNLKPVGENEGQAMNINHVHYRDRILLHSWNFTHCCYSLVPAVGGELRTVQLMFNTTYAMVLEKKSY